MDNSGYKGIVSNFSVYRLSRAFKEERPTIRKEMLRTLMRLNAMPEENMEVDVSQAVVPYEKLIKNQRVKIQGQQMKVKGEQKKILNSLENPGQKILAVQAPAGTGKTNTISLYISKLLERNLGITLVTAPTNLAVQEIAEKVLSQKRLRNGDIIFLQSAADEEMMDQKQKPKAWVSCRIPEILQGHMCDEMPEANTPFVRRYLSKRLAHDKILTRKVKPSRPQ
ncbi:unnamed protein product [Enterobius vermicularis]|uniref:AAA_11 domain-containing protein n=1 Tax=Enterobius vermicularis TaxID=51028 RepID=A0A0N4V421_ENTVE|nr:unnamed protein product [Enterobius vermicularis]